MALTLQWFMYGSHTHTHPQSDFPAYVHHQMLFHILMFVLLLFWKYYALAAHSIDPSVTHRSGSTKHDTFSRLSQIFCDKHTLRLHSETVVPDTSQSGESQNSLRSCQTQELGAYTSTLCIKLWSHACSAEPFKHKYTHTYRLTKIRILRDAPNLTLFLDVTVWNGTQASQVEGVFKYLYVRFHHFHSVCEAVDICWKLAFVERECEICL